VSLGLTVQAARLGTPHHHRGGCLLNPQQLATAIAQMTKEEQMMVGVLADRLLTQYVKNADHMVVKDLKYLAKLSAYFFIKERR
jgi:hypothetical protein